MNKSKLKKQYKHQVAQVKHQRAIFKKEVARRNEANDWPNEATAAFANRVVSEPDYFSKGVKNQTLM